MKNRIIDIWKLFSKINAGCAALLSGQISLVMHTHWPLYIRILLFIFFVAVFVTSICSAVLSAKEIKIYSNRKKLDFLIMMLIAFAIISPLMASNSKSAFVNSLIGANQQPTTLIQNN